MRKSFETTIRVPLPCLEAIELFTPKGEEAWVPGWKPRYHEPATGETVPGMVFETGEGVERTIWTCLDWNPAQGSAHYLRVVPGQRVSRVRVRCSEAGMEQSDVTVCYEHTTLSPSGEAWLSGLRQPAFEAEISQWQGYVETALAEGRIAAAAA